MGDSVKRVLFVNSEIFPYLPQTRISDIGRYLPQGIQERKKEIRSFMPRYGCINERKNQLHEVIRLSGIQEAFRKQEMNCALAETKLAAISPVYSQLFSAPARRSAPRGRGSGGSVVKSCVFPSIFSRLEGGTAEMGTPSARNSR